MSKIILKESAVAYDGVNSIDDIVKKYHAYLSIISKNESALKSEYIKVQEDFFERPNVFNTRKFEAAKNKMLELGLLKFGSDRQNDNFEPEM